MSLEVRNSRLELPDRMRDKLEGFRRRVWIVKLTEGVLAALFGLMVSYLFVFALDRLMDTPAILRATILLVGAAGLGIWFPLVCHRWIWRSRQLEQVARLLRFKFPRLSDHLLGIIELVHNESEQNRSEALCRAALKQVDQEASQQDFSNAVPHPRHRQWAWIAGVPLVIVVIGLVVVPAAGGNAMLRWLMPWKQIDRYTFAQLNDDLPKTKVVPYAEPFEVNASLSETTQWRPNRGKARIPGQPAVRVNREDDQYRFQMPPQKESGKLAIAVGDDREAVEIVPTTRPELTEMVARVKLPDYLQRTTEVVKDVRGGSVSLVEGSKAVFEAKATRDLAEATADERPLKVDGNTLETWPVSIDQSKKMLLQWTDQVGLTAKQPFNLKIRAHEDQAPSLICSRLENHRVVLDEDTLSFTVDAEDDYGIKRIGMEWVGVKDPIYNPEPAEGEKLVAEGKPDWTNMDGVVATFAAKREGIAPQTIQLRLFVDDYLPDRERVYSPVYTLHVMNAEQHSIWLTKQADLWYRQALETYEREQQLYRGNQELRGLSPEEIDRPENRRKIEAQAAAEMANARRLDAVTKVGEELIKQAMRNDQFNVNTLEKWAEMQNALKEIAAKRMPSVADLLKEAANAPGQAQEGQPQDSQSGQDKTPPAVGNNRGKSGGGGKDDGKEKPVVPQIVDIESQFGDDENKGENKDSPPGGGAPKFGLPNTVLQGGPQPEGGNQSCPANDKMDEAVEEQEDLLAEFAKVAEELKKILSNLEGSTFVKRLKAQSRRQQEIASDVNRGTLDSFGMNQRKVKQSNQERFALLAKRERAHSDDVYKIQDDLESYFNRVQEGKFKTVLDEMKNMEVVSQVKDVAGQIEDNLTGRSMAHAEFLADNFDRWAEQLVGPG